MGKDRKMEHTEGKLIIGNGKGFDMEGMRHLFIKTEKGYVFGRIDGHLNGLSCGKPDISMDEALANAQRLVKCWNEHDTLTAKADLLEYALDWAEALKTLLVQISDTELPNTAETIKRIETLLSKAKDL